MLSLGTTLAAGVAALALAPAAADAGVTSGAHTVASYDFHGTDASSIGAPAPLTPHGASVAFDTSTRDGQSVSHLHLGQQSGVTAPLPALGEDYSIAFNFRASDVDGRNRVLGFRSPVVDDGFYVVDGKLVFDNGFDDAKSATPTAIAANAWTHVVITRSTASLVKVYVNGVFEFHFVDTPDDMKLAGVLGLFTDDNFERSAADIARLQVFDAALSAAEATGMERYDGTPPTAEITSPAAHGGTRYIGKDTYGSGTLSDTGTQSPTAEVRLEKLNGDLVATRQAYLSPPFALPAAGTSMTSRFNYAFVGAPVTDGEQYNVVVESVDKAGNTKEDVSAVLGDTTPPTGLTIGTPGGQITDRTPMLTGTLPASEREATYTLPACARAPRASRGAS